MSAPRIPAVAVDLDAIRANVRAVRERVGVPVMAVVKADAYGHGALPVARAALDGGADWLGVVDAAEGVALRAAGIEAPILAWIHSPATTWFSAFAAELDLAVSSMAQLQQIADAAADPRRGRHASRIGIHVKVDTGLGRNGAHEREWRQLFGMLAEQERRGILSCRGVMSHLSGASEADDARQIAAFERALATADAEGARPQLRHLAASAAGIANPAARYDLVRLGVAAYGLSPFEPGRDPGVELAPALRLDAPVREVEGRELLEVGLVDGLPPVRAGRLELRGDDGSRWRIEDVGEVATSVARIAEGETGGAAIVEAAGDRQDRTTGGDEPGAGPTLGVIDPGNPLADADAWAAAARTINYEITTRCAPRLPRAYLPETPIERTVVPWPPLEDPQRPVLAPRRLARIDLELAARRLRELAARARRHPGVPFADAVDVSADAYGHGALELVRLVRAAGLRPAVRTHLDAHDLRRRGLADLAPEPALPGGTRAVYGFDPADPAASLMALSSELISVKRVAAGQGVSYGLEWVARAPATLGLVPLGYADAIPRRAAGRAHLVIGGLRARVLGRVAMDQVVVDLTEIDAWPGASVSVFGPRAEETSLREWAGWCGVPPAAVTSTLGSRVDRVWEGRP